MRQIKEKKPYRDGEEGLKQQITDLEISLDLGPPIVQGQYDSDFRKFGETYARGDSIAREQLKDVLITLQMAVLSNLSGVSLGTRMLDHRALQIASDDSRVNAVLCLAQWQQRLSSAATAQQHMSTPYPFDHHSRSATPPLTNASLHSDWSSTGDGAPKTPDDPNNQMSFLNLVPTLSGSGYASPLTPGPPAPQNDDDLFQAEDIGEIDMPSPLRPRILLSRGEPVRPSDTPQPIPLRSPHRPIIAGFQQTSQSRPTIDTLNQPLPSPMSPVSPIDQENERNTSAKLNSPGLPRSLDSPTINYSVLYNSTNHDSRRTPSSGSKASTGQKRTSGHSTLEVVCGPSPGDIHPAYRINEHQSQARSPSTTSTLTPRSPQHPPPPPLPAKPQFQPLQRNNSQDTHISIFQPTYVSPTSSSSNSHTTPNFSSLSLTLNLPTESNNYLGFCKGAYKLQIGLPPKKAFSVELRPQGFYTSTSYWRCSKCSFEGPMYNTIALPGSCKKAGKLEKLFDPRIRMSEGGIAYRWAFLAKCHVPTKGAGTATVGRNREGTYGTFGCLFCCAEGVGRGWIGDPDGGGGSAKWQSCSSSTTTGSGKDKGKEPRKKVTSAPPNTNPNSMPLFGNVDTFMQHLEFHRTPAGMPGLEMQGRMRCVVGRSVEVGEEFDIHLPPPAPPPSVGG